MAKRNVLHRVESLWFKFTASISFFQFTLLCHNHRAKNIRIQTFFFWSVYSHLQTEYGNLQSKSPYSTQVQKNTDQEKHRIRIFSGSGFSTKLTRRMD